MNQEVRLKLIEVAKDRRKTFITYQDLSDSCKLGLDMMDPSSGPIIGRILDAVSIFEHEQKRPLLSVVAVRGKEKTPGPGFYTLCEKLKFGRASKLQDDEDFTTMQNVICKNFWMNETNYAKFK